MEYKIAPKMILRNQVIQLIDILIREPRLVLKYYHVRMTSASNTKSVFMVDGRRPHGGMFDRLKGIISIYALSKIQGVSFKIHFVYPFELSKYLIPNVYDWRVCAQDVCYDYPSSRPVIAYGEYQNPRRLWKKRKGETHFYYGYNSLDIINCKFGTCFEWGELYRELFKPSPYLQERLDVYRRQIGGKYIVVHTRFLNLLGDKVETDINPELFQEEKQLLMDSCLEKIKELSKCFTETEPSGRVMIASDSMTFIEFMKRKLPEIYVVPGVVKHIDTAGKTSDDENLKMFIDYYMIAGAEKIYNLVGKGMWKSAFSEYSAKIGNKSFERIFL